MFFSHFISLSLFYFTFHFFIKNVKPLEIVSLNYLIKRQTNKLLFIIIIIITHTVCLMIWGLKSDL